MNGSRFSIKWKRSYVSKHETIFKTITPNAYPKRVGEGLHFERREVNSINSNTSSYGSPMMQFSQTRDSLGSKCSLSSESTVSESEVF